MDPKQKPRPLRKEECMLEKQPWIPTTKVREVFVSFLKIWVHSIFVFWKEGSSRDREIEWQQNISKNARNGSKAQAECIVLVRSWRTTHSSKIRESKCKQGKKYGCLEAKQWKVEAMLVGGWECEWRWTRYHQLKIREKSEISHLKVWDKMDKTECLGEGFFHTSGAGKTLQ